MTPMLIGALLLLILGLGLVVLEVFIPSGGLIGCLAGLALITSVILAFARGPMTGLGVLATVLVLLPLLLAVALHYWPRTPMGKRILLEVPTSEAVLPDEPVRQRLKLLVGQIGRAKCMMLPSGVIEVGGQTVDAMSEGMAIDLGQMVRVIEVRGHRVVVRPVEGEEPVTPVSGDLAQPIDSIADDPFSEPLA
jgi:membrane-bound ClpP family serine protease